MTASSLTVYQMIYKSNTAGQRTEIIISCQGKYHSGKMLHKFLIENEKILLKCHVIKGIYTSYINTVNPFNCDNLYQLLSAGTELNINHEMLKILS